MFSNKDKEKIAEFLERLKKTKHEFFKDKEVRTKFNKLYEMLNISYVAFHTTLLATLIYTASKLKY